MPPGASTRQLLASIASNWAWSRAKCSTALLMTTEADRSGIDRPFNRLGAKVFWREGGRQPRGKLAHGADGVGVLIDGVDLAARAQQIDEIAAPAAAGVEDTIAWRDAAAQQLVEQIDVDPAELGLEIHRRRERSLYLLGAGPTPAPRAAP